MEGIEVYEQPTLVSVENRSEIKNQSPKTFWFTGFSGAGKSALANNFELYLHRQKKHTMLLDGDNLRLGLTSDLSFSLEDRHENIRRVAQVAKLMNQAGLIVIVAMVSPTKADRQMAKEIIGEAFFREIFVETSLEECEKRDVKGLYKKARLGEIQNFTGISQPYQIPENPFVRIDTTNKSQEQVLSEFLEKLKWE